MHRDEAPALRGTWLGTLLRYLNGPMRLVLGSPFHWPLSRWFMVLRWVGSRTGRAHAIPVSYVLEQGGVYATTGDGWWQNAMRAGDVSVTCVDIRRRRRSFQ